MTDAGTTIYVDIYIAGGPKELTEYNSLPKAKRKKLGGDIAEYIGPYGNWSAVPIDILEESEFDEALYAAIQKKLAEYELTTGRKVQVRDPDPSNPDDSTRMNKKSSYYGHINGKKYCVHESRLYIDDLVDRWDHDFDLDPGTQGPASTIMIRFHLVTMWEAGQA